MAQDDEWTHGRATLLQRRVEEAARAVGVAGYAQDILAALVWRRVGVDAREKPFCGFPSGGGRRSLPSTAASASTPWNLRMILD